MSAADSSAVVPGNTGEVGGGFVEVRPVVGSCVAAELPSSFYRMLDDGSTMESR